VNCPICGVPIALVTVSVDPRKAEHRFAAGCGHELTVKEARAAWRSGSAVGPVPKIDGAALVAAERARHVAEEGHTPDQDAALTGGQLSWAAWCLLDRAGAENPPEQAPSVWPLPLDRWPTDKSSLRYLIIAASFIVAEIDRRLAAGEKP
jgi:hypothetical protein